MNAERPNPETLERVPLFAALSREEVDEIITAASLQTFEPDEVILRQGMISQNLWVLLEGRCEVVKDVPFGGRGTPVVLAETEPFAIFGEMSFLDNVASSASVWAKTQVKVLKIRRFDFDELARDRPAIAYKVACNIVLTLSHRVRYMNDWVSKLLEKYDTAPLHDQWKEIRQRLESELKGWIL